MFENRKSAATAGATTEGDGNSAVRHQESRRRFLRTAAKNTAIALGALSGGAAIELGRQTLDMKDKSIEGFGPLAEPKFLIADDTKFAKPFFSFRGYLRQQINQQDLSEQDLRRIRLRVQRTRASLERSMASQSADQNDPVANLLRFSKETHTLSILENALTDTLLSLTKNVSSSADVNLSMLELQEIAGRGKVAELSPRFGPPEDIVKKIVTELTGRKIPDDISIRIEDIKEESVRGLANQMTRAIQTEDMHYALVIATIAHEVGHLLAPHYEQSFLSGDIRSHAEIKNWEEACAYAFSECVANTLPERPLSLASTFVLLDRIAFLKEYYSGKETRECHRVGMAMWDAALEVLGPAKAHKFLVSNTQLTPEILGVMEENKRLYAEYLAAGSQPRYEEARRLVEELSKEIAAAKALYKQP